MYKRPIASLLVIVVVLMLVHSVFAAKTGATSGGAVGGEGCDDGYPRPDGRGKHFECDVWGPVIWGDSESYTTQLDSPTQDKLTNAKCTSDTLRNACKCLVGGTFDILVPGPQFPDYDPVVDGSVRLGTARVFEGVGATAGRVEVADTDGALTVVATSSAKAPEPIAGTPFDIFGGTNTIRYHNKNRKSSQSCYHIEYGFDLITDGDGDPTHCETVLKGDFLDGVTNLALRCCGDDKAPGEDFMMLVETEDSAGTKSEALCVQTRSKRDGQDEEWKWISFKNPGEVELIDYYYTTIDADANTVETTFNLGTAVYTEQGPRFCAPRTFPASTYGIGAPALLRVEVAQPPQGYVHPSSPDSIAGAPKHGYTCVAIGEGPVATSAHVILECVGADLGNVYTTNVPGYQENYAKKPGDVAKRVAAHPAQDLYCSSKEDGRWTDDLDDDKDACNEVADDDGNKIFKWTGNKCCGDDGVEEYYNDPWVIELDPYDNSIVPGTSSGCWRGKTIFGYDRQSPPDVYRIVGELFPNDADLAGISNQSIVNYNGTFHGCNIPSGHGILSKMYCEPETYCNGNTLMKRSGLCVDSPIATCTEACSEAEDPPGCTLPPVTCEGGALVQPSPVGGSSTELDDCGGHGCTGSTCDAEVIAVTKVLYKDIKAHLDVAGTRRNVKCRAVLLDLDPRDNALSWPTKEQTKRCYNRKGEMRIGLNRCYPVYQPGVKLEVLDDVNPCEGIRGRACTRRTCENWLLGNHILIAGEPVNSTSNPTTNLWIGTAKPKLEGTDNGCTCGADPFVTPGNAEFKVRCYYPNSAYTAAADEVICTEANKDAAQPDPALVQTIYAAEP